MVFFQSLSTWCKSERQTPQYMMLIQTSSALGEVLSISISCRCFPPMNAPEAPYAFMICPGISQQLNYLNLFNLLLIIISHHSLQDKRCNVGRQLLFAGDKKAVWRILIY